MSVAITKCGHIPIGMEQWPAVTSDNLSVIDAEIHACDIYVGIVGGSFGSPLQDSAGTDERISYTQYEFRKALEYGKHVLLFLMQTDDYKRYRSGLGVDDRERQFDADLATFRAEVESSKGHGARLVCKFPFDQNDLNPTIHSITQDMMGGVLWLESSKALSTRGLVPNDSDTIVAKHVRDNPALMRVLRTFSNYELPSRRAALNRRLKEGIARFFWDTLFGTLMKGNYRRLFFESGSTLMFVARIFLDRLQTQRAWEQYFQECKTSVNLKTNNILVFLEFLLTSYVRIDLWPSGRPDDKYGATFGDISRLPPLLPSDVESTTDVTAVERQLLTELSSEHAPQIFLVGASGFNYCDDMLKAGPHVGDYSNMLFKRVLLRARQPVVFFVDESKFSLDTIKLGRYNVCTEEFTWQQAVDTTPIAFCLGTTTESMRDQISQTLGNQGFSSRSVLEPTPGEYPDCLPYLVTNNLFRKALSLPD